MENPLRINKYGLLAPHSGIKIILPNITPDKAVDMWESIYSLIRDYTKVHPQEMRLFMETNAHARRKVNNKYAASRSMSIRWGMNLPPGLDVLIRKFHPDVFDNKRKFRMFMRKFPGFRVCDVV